MPDEELLGRIVRVFQENAGGGCDFSKVGLDTPLESISAIDSFTLIRTIVALEREFKVSIESDDMRATLRSLRTIMEYLKSKNALRQSR